MKNLIKCSDFSCLGFAFSFFSSSEDDYTSSPTLEFSTEKIEMSIGKSVTVEVRSGTDPYTVVSSDENIANVNVDKNIVTISGVNLGNAMIIVTDQNNITGTLYVNITDHLPGDLDISMERATIVANVNQGKDSVIKIIGGIPPYKVNSKDMQIAESTVNDSEVIISGITVGITTITVTDNNKKSVGTIEVEVK